MIGNQMLEAKRGRLGRLGRQIPTYAYARARVIGIGSGFGKLKNLILSANILPSLPSLPNKKKEQVKTGLYVIWVCGVLPPIWSVLPPLPPTSIQYFAEQ